MLHSWEISATYHKSDRTGEMGLAYVNGVQKGKRRDVGKNAIARMAANCKHFAAFGTPQGGL